MFRNLIFDWSGTLVDDLGPVVDATNHVFRKYGLEPMDRVEFRRRFRLPYGAFYEEVLPGVALRELEEHFRAGFAASTAEVLVLPHAREKLEWCLDQGIRLFVLTSVDPPEFDRQLELFGLRDVFEATYSGVLDKREVIHRIIADHGLDPTETAFVGDMTHDIETAHHAELTAVAVLTGYMDAAVLAEARPHLTVPDLATLRTLMERRGARGPVATVGALIRDAGDDGERLLMIRTHKWGDRWGIPGGKIRRGEGSVAALRREVREETGLEVGEPRFVMVQDCIDSPEFERPEHFLLLNYVVERTSGEVVLNDEAEEFRWVSPGDALAMDLNQPTRILIERVIAEGGSAS